MTYRIKILRLDGSFIESDINKVFDFMSMTGYYVNPSIINTKFVNVSFSKTSGDIEEVIYQEVKLEN
jgi:hypothetical protein